MALRPYVYGMLTGSLLIGVVHLGAQTPPPPPACDADIQKLYLQLVNEKILEGPSPMVWGAQLAAIAQETRTLWNERNLLQSQRSQVERGWSRLVTQVQDLQREKAELMLALEQAKTGSPLGEAPQAQR